MHAKTTSDRNHAPDALLNPAKEKSSRSRQRNDGDDGDGDKYKIYRDLATSSFLSPLSLHFVFRFVSLVPSRPSLPFTFPSALALAFDLSSFSTPLPLSLAPSSYLSHYISH
jgi:hypothetical protein